MKLNMKRFGEWLRHKVRVVILKQWKVRPRIYKNLMKLNRVYKCGIDEQRIYGIANARQGLYAMATIKEINFLLSPKVLGTPNRKEDRPGLVNPLDYYLEKRHM